MEQHSDTMELLDLMVRPAFCVKDGVIVRVNPAAQSRMIDLGTPVADRMVTGAEEYKDYTGGCLYLVMTIAGQSCGVSVTRMNEFDVFVLEQDSEQAELQAMALAAQELRRPLASIMTVSDRLFASAASGADPATQEQIARMNRGLFQLLRIVSNMSDAARYTSQDSASPETRDVCAVFNEVFQKAGDMLAEAGIALHFSGISGPVFCLADAELLERAVYNILSNAMKFTPKGGAIAAKLTRRGEMLYLTVQDSGQSIPQSLRGSVFSRYLRAPSIEDGRYGIGLGLVLVRSAAALHGGTVLMEQPEGGGVRITMTMAIRQRTDGLLRSPVFSIDYAGERDHGLLELSDVLPAGLYEKEKIN